MNYTRLTVPDMVLMTPEVFGDHRGFFMETFRDSDFREKVSDMAFVQDNYSGSVQGTLRGLHYQIQQTQGKLVRVTKGEVFDVGVDLRRSSPNFGQWSGAVLSEENKEMLWIPPGFAHGFYVMSTYAEFSYKCTDYYAPEHERTILWDDPDIGIDWPVDAGAEVLLSEKDRKGKAFRDAEVFS